MRLTEGPQWKQSSLPSGRIRNPAWGSAETSIGSFSLLLKLLELSKVGVSLRRVEGGPKYDKGVSGGRSRLSQVTGAWNSMGSETPTRQRSCLFQSFLLPTTQSHRPGELYKKFYCSP